MKIFIGADHRGYKLKKEIIKFLVSKLGQKVVDLGIYQDRVTCDYPKIAYKVGKEVVKSKNNLGVLVCMTGIGQSIAANKIRGVYAALCYTKKAAAFARQHNNANVLVLGARFVKRKEISKIIKAWLDARFEGGRHLRRVNQIKEIEKGN